MNLLNSTQIEKLVVRHFNPRANIIVPNVSWGLLQYEADLVILRPSMYAIEVEIKTSKADIKRDLLKRHSHDSDLFRELWFAIPEALKDDVNIPTKAGIMAVEKRRNGVGFQLRIVRRGTLNKYASKWTPTQKDKLLNLGCMRIWSLKEALWRKEQ